MTKIGIGIIGGGYMGKAHSVEMSSVGAVFNTKLRPHLEMIAASTPQIVFMWVSLNDSNPSGYNVVLQAVVNDFEL